MIILITGASGLLGRYLLQTKPQYPEGVVGEKVIPCYRSHPIKYGTRLDVSNKEELIFTLWNAKPDVIIHCAANGDVDSVESQPSEAVKSDLLGTIHLVEYCERTGCKLVTVSSNAVYDGENPLYDESSPREPVNYYGRFKSMSDAIVERSKCKWIIIRPILLYGIPGESRGNWVTRILNSEKVKVVEDVYTQPTYAKDVAEIIWNLIASDRWNQSFNVASEEKMTLYDFAIKVKEGFHLHSLEIEGAKLKDFNIAPRPKDTCFDLKKLHSVGLRCHSVEEGLNLMKNEA